MGLIRKLQQRQGERGQVEFAGELKISQSSLSRIYSGDRRVGVRVGKAIAEKYPDLAWDVAAFLLGTDRADEEEQVRSAS